MLTAPIPANEEQRLDALRSLNVLDSPPEERFDRITRVATYIFKVPISTVTLVDSDREWFKSCQGLPAKEGERAISFCGHAMLAPDIFIIPDAKADPRFSDNPMVVGSPFIRFYAGVPLSSAEGFRIGTFCIKDHVARELKNEEIKVLKALASWAELELNLHELSKALNARKTAETKVTELNDILKLLNKILRHDILNDLTVVKGGLDQYFIDKDKESLDNTLLAVERGIGLIEKMRELESAVSSGKPLVPTDVSEVAKKVCASFSKLKSAIEGKALIMADEAFYSVIQNIVRNIELHSGSSEVAIKIEETKSSVQISIADFGKGISDEVKKNLFQENYFCIPRSAG